MSHTMDNLEKLIQIATIEQMYNMLQRLKTDNSIHVKECNLSDGINAGDNYSCINSILQEIKTEINDIKVKTNNREFFELPADLVKKQIKTATTNLLERTHKLESELEHCNERFVKSSKINEELLWELSNTTGILSERIKQLETELNGIKNNSDNNSKFLCQQIRGQQKLSSYPGFSNGSQSDNTIDENKHIQLKIEETINLDKKLDSSIHETEDNFNEEKTDCLKVLETDEDEEDSETEVCTDNEKDVLMNIERTPVESQQDEDDIDETMKIDNPNVETKEEEEEEEEVFEIEIDDITYFASGEENGILYEMTSDGDIGKKVGIIKDGEPIFN